MVAFVNIRGDPHTTTKAPPPLFVEAVQESRGGVARFHSFSSNAASHLSRIDRKANTLTHQGRAMTTCVTGQQQTIAREVLQWSFRREESRVVFNGAGVLNCIS